MDGARCVVVRCDTRRVREDVCGTAGSRCADERESYGKAPHASRGAAPSVGLRPPLSELVPRTGRGSTMVARTPAWNPGSTDVPPRLPCLDRLACADEGDRIAVPRCRLLTQGRHGAFCRFVAWC